MLSHACPTICITRAGCGGVALGDCLIAERLAELYIDLTFTHLTCVHTDSPPNEGYGYCFDVNVTEPKPPPNPGLCPVTATAQAGAGPPMSGFGGGNYSAAWDGMVRDFSGFHHRFVPSLS